jgi:type II secretory pathway component PulF
MFHDPFDSSITDALHALGLQLEAGVSLKRALEVSSKSCRTSRGRRAFDCAAGAVADQQPFERVLDHFATILAYSERTIMAAGWESGNPAWAIDSIVDRRRRLYDVRRHVRGAMIKPVLTLLIAGLVIPFPRFFLGKINLVGFLIEGLGPIGIGLFCWMTMGVASTMRQRAWASRAVDRPPPPTLGDRLLLALPLTASLQRLRNLSEFALLMSNLLGAGIMTVEALKLAARSLPNGIYRRRIYRVAEQVESGTPLGQCLTGRGWPIEWSAMMEVADQTGEPDKLFERLGRFTSERYVSAVERVGSVVPKLIYAVIALYIAYQIVTMWAGLAGQIDAATR